MKLVVLTKNPVIFWNLSLLGVASFTLLVIYGLPYTSISVNVSQNVKS